LPPVLGQAVLEFNFMQPTAHKDISDTFRLIEGRLARVRELVREQFDPRLGGASADELLDSFHCLGGGKMIRPALVLLSGACCGDIVDLHLRVAAIVEMIHNATLLHDDVMDQGQKRRGRPTVNFLKGNEYAVLMGDLLLSKASVMCAELPVEINRIIAATSMEVCRGELTQTARRGDWDLTESEYIDIITEKSASLFGCCCRLGGILAQADEAQVAVLGEFGLNIGIAFQITDDLLDLTGDEQKAGKTLGTDVNKNKPTLALIHLLRTVSQGERASVIESLECEKIDTAGRMEIAKMLSARGSLKYARDLAESKIVAEIKTRRYAENSV